MLDSPRVTASLASASSHAETAPTESVHEKWSSALLVEWSFFTKLMTYSGACEACVCEQPAPIDIDAACALFLDRRALFIDARLLARVAGDEVCDECAHCRIGAEPSSHDLSVVMGAWPRGHGLAARPQ